MKKVNALVLGLVVMLAFGCGKDEPEPQDSQKLKGNICLLIQDSIAGGSETKNYYYNNDDKLIRVEWKAYNSLLYYFLLEYDNAGRISRRNSYDARDSTIFSRLTYQYNNQGKLTKTELFNLDPYTKQLTSIGYNNYSYNSSGKISVKELFNSASTKPFKVYKFAYLPNGIIEQSHFIGFDGAGNPYLQDITEFVYDANKHPFNDEIYALSYNTYCLHNIVAEKYYDYQHNFLRQVITTYQYNSKGYPIKATTNVVPVKEKYFKYNCQ